MCSPFRTSGFLAFSQTLALNAPCTCCTPPPTPSWPSGLPLPSVAFSFSQAGRLSCRQSKPNGVAGDQPPNHPFAGPGEKNSGRVSSSNDLHLLLAGKRVSLTTKQSQRNCQTSLMKGWPCFLRAPRSRRPVPRVDDKEVWLRFTRVDIQSRQRRFLRPAPFSSSA